MVTVELGVREAIMLREVLQNDLSDLRQEIYKTEAGDVKAVLKDREALLHRLIDRLGMDTQETEMAA